MHFGCVSCSRCSNQTAAWQPLAPETEALSILTNISYSETRKISRVHSQVTFHKPQQLTVRCETSNQGGLDRRDIKLLTNSKCVVGLTLEIFAIIV